MSSSGRVDGHGLTRSRFRATSQRRSSTKSTLAAQDIRRGPRTDPGAIASGRASRRHPALRAASTPSRVTKLVLPLAASLPRPPCPASRRRPRRPAGRRRSGRPGPGRGRRPSGACALGVLRARQDQRGARRRRRSGPRSSGAACAPPRPGRRATPSMSIIWPPTMPRAPRGHGQARAPARRGSAPSAWVSGWARISKATRLQRVAGQHGGGLVVRLVHGRPAAAQVVVVHARQVVVDQAVGVDALQRAGGAQHRPLLAGRTSGRSRGRRTARSRLPSPSAA